MSAHLCGLTGVLLLVGRGRISSARAFAAALALGYAITIRPDAVLYLVPAAALALALWWPQRHAAGIGRLAPVCLGLLIGLAPSLAYYWVATGNPFVPTQSMEVAEFLGTPDTPAGSAAEPDAAPEPATPDGRVGYPPGAWRGTTLSPVSGGGLKLENLPTTLPGHWEKIRTAYGTVLLGLAALGLVVAGIRRPAFAVAIGSYLVAALLVYSCWSRPYGRYLVSIWLLVPVLIVEGALGSLELVRYLYRRRAVEAARWLAVGAATFLVLGCLIAGPPADGTALQALTRLLAFGSAGALIAAVVWPARRIATLAVPLLVLLLVALASVRLWQTLATTAPFRGPEAAHATSVVKRALVPPALVITSEDIGRPAENLEYYADVRALYLTDLARWQVPVRDLVFQLLLSEVEPYLLLSRATPEREQILSSLRRDGFSLVELVAEIPRERAAEYFVSSPFLAAAPLELWHVR
jgi:hypothetical protein